MHRVTLDGDWYPLAIPEALIVDPAVSASAVRVYAALVAYAVVGQPWPGYRRFSSTLPMTRQTAMRAVDALEQAGWIAVDRDDWSIVVAGKRRRP